MPILAKETSLFPANLLDQYTGNDVEQNWWAIYTRSRSEKAVAREMLTHDLPFYLPLIRKEQFHRGRRTHSFLPLFSGYLFFYGSDEDRVLTMSINRHRISRILPIEDQDNLAKDLRNLRQLIDSDAPLTVESRLERGDRVRVKSGAFKGVEGVVLKRKNSIRLLVAVDYLQQGVSMEIDDFMLEPV